MSPKAAAIDLLHIPTLFAMQFSNQWGVKAAGKSCIIATTFVLFQEIAHNLLCGHE